VEVTRDLAHAKVFVTALQPERSLEAMKALKAIAPELRYALGRSMKLRHVPELHFHYDDSVDRGERIDNLLRDNPPSSTIATPDRRSVGHGPPTFRRKPLAGRVPSTYRPMSMKPRTPAVQKAPRQKDLPQARRHPAAGQAAGAQLQPGAAARPPPVPRREGRPYRQPRSARHRPAAGLLRRSHQIAGLLLGSRKAYETTAELGLTTDSDDADGAPLLQRDVPELDDARIEAALAPLRGPIRQRAPIFSALKQGGEPLYAKARRGETIEAPERDVVVHTFAALARDAHAPALQSNAAPVPTVRSLVRDLGEAWACAPMSPRCGGSGSILHRPAHVPRSRNCRRWRRQGECPRRLPVPIETRPGRVSRVVLMLSTRWGRASVCAGGAVPRRWCDSSTRPGASWAG
jgi:hypothetical protein